MASWKPALVRLKVSVHWRVKVRLRRSYPPVTESICEPVRHGIADGPWLELIQRFLKQGVMESGKGCQAPFVVK